ncbi:MAG TPA: response regulator transcription factor [Actinopolymorphaceae bacterium]
MRVLLADDEVALAETVRRGLERDGSVVEVVHNGEDAVWAASESAFDVLVLDIMMPKGNGYQVIRELRRRGIWTPVLMLTAIDQDDRLATALDAGADDYLTKPFSFVVLLARLRALVRRGAPERPAILRTGDLSLDPASRAVSRGDEAVRLTPREFGLLQFMMRHAGDVVSKSAILDGVWDAGFEGDDNVVEVYIRYLRNKVDVPFGRQSLQTVRGMGYRLDPQGG